IVSKASELLPLPERPVTTTISSRGRETVTFFRLCSRAPRTTIRFSAISYHPFSSLLLRKYTAPAREAKGEITFRNFTICRPTYGLTGPQLPAKGAAFLALGLRHSRGVRP